MALNKRQSVASFSGLTAIISGLVGRHFGEFVRRFDEEKRLL